MPTAIQLGLLQTDAIYWRARALNCRQLKCVHTDRSQLTYFTGAVPYKTRQPGAQKKNKKQKTSDLAQRWQIWPSSALALRTIVVGWSVCLFERVCNVIKIIFDTGTM